jgi:hypothetical protein
MLAALELGRFIVKLPAARGLGGLEARLGAQLQALGGERAAIAQQLGALEAGTLPEAGVTELLAKIQDLYARELQLLDTAAKQGVTEPALHQAIAAYQTQIALVELKLAKAGVASAHTGPQLFRQVRPGVVAYQLAGRSVLDLMYGGALAAGDRPGELVGTLPGGEKTFFLTEEAAGKEQHAREGEGSGVDRQRALGADPATGQFRQNEMDTALRLEAATGAHLERFQPGPGEKGDWHDRITGLVYDGCSPGPEPYFNKSWNKYTRSLADHLAHPTVARVVIDVTGLGLKPEQLQKLESHLASLPAEQHAKIVRIGF